MGGALSYGGARSQELQNHDDATSGTGLARMGNDAVSHATQGAQVSPSLSPCLPPSFSPTLPVFLSPSLNLSLPPSLFPPLPLSLSPPLPLSLPSLPPSLSLCASRSLSLTRTQGVRDALVADIGVSRSPPAVEEQVHPPRSSAREAPPPAQTRSNVDQPGPGSRDATNGDAGQRRSGSVAVDSRGNGAGGGAVRELRQKFKFGVVATRTHAHTHTHTEAVDGGRLGQTGKILKSDAGAGGQRSDGGDRKRAPFTGVATGR